MGLTSSRHEVSCGTSSLRSRFSTSRRFIRIFLRVNRRVRSLCRQCASRRDSQPIATEWSSSNERLAQVRRVCTHSLRCAWLLACLPGVYRLLQVNSVSTAYAGHYRKAEKPIAIGRRSFHTRPHWHIDRFNRVGAGWVVSAKTGARFAKLWRRPRYSRLRRWLLHRTLHPRGCEIFSCRRLPTNARDVETESTRWKRSARWTRSSSTSSASSASSAASISR